MNKTLWKPEGTPESRQTCETVAEYSDGTCFLGFSRGKDSLAALIWLREFFDTIVLYHCAIVPGLSFVDKSLEHYENFFDIKIERFMHRDALNSVAQLVYQPIEDDEKIAALGIWDFQPDDIVEFLREDYDVPDAWTAFGISGADSIFRRMRLEKNMGITSARWVFYPCWNWSREQIIGTVENTGCGLPADYLLWDRTVNGLPDVRCLANMKKMFPQDYEKIRIMFPLIEAMEARNEFRFRKAQELVKESPVVESAKEKPSPVKKKASKKRAKRKSRKSKKS